MKTLKPTEAELLERGFKKYNEKLSVWYLEFPSLTIGYELGTWTISDGEDFIYFYPTSFEDIETLVSLFTPKE